MEASEYIRLRALMVDEQLLSRGIDDRRVLEAMRTVPRHEFVDSPLAYADMALKIEAGQTISQPYMVAAMTQSLMLKGTERVLEIGTGSGYQTAVLALLAGEVYTIERHAILTEHARARLTALGYANVTCLTGDGTLGWAEAAPFDRILITAAAPELPEPLIGQLKMGGIIVAPVGTRFSQVVIRATLTESGLEEEFFTPCMFVPLIGEYGWKGSEL